MNLLGLDPGATSTGFARVSVSDRLYIKAEDYGTIPIIDGHFLDTFKWIEAYIKEHDIPTIGYEIAFFGQGNFQPPIEKIQTVQVQGIIELIGEIYGLSVQSWYAVSVRSAIIGSHAKKPQVRTALKKFLNLPKNIQDNHAVDALAVACCTATRLYKAKWPVEGKQTPLPFAQPKPKKRKLKVSELTDEQLLKLAAENRLLYEGNKIVGVKT